LKMATGRHFPMSGINSRHHNLPTHEMSLKSDKVHGPRKERKKERKRIIIIIRRRNGAKTISL
jgi:hypothetical protein